MNPNELRMKKAAKLAEAQTLQSQLDDEALGLSDDQRKEVAARADKLIDEAEELETKAKAIEAEEAESRKRSDRMKALNETGANRVPGAEIGDGTPRVEVKEPEFTGDPMKGFPTSRKFFDGVVGLAKREPEAMEDPRLKYLAVAGTDEHQAGSDPYGSVLIPEGMSPNLQSVPSENDPFAGRLTSIPMDTPTVKIPARTDKDHTSSVSGGLTVSRRSETASATSSRMELESVKLEANGLFGFSYATEELLERSPRSVAALLSVGFGDEFRSQRIKDLLRGTGSGEPEGVQNNPALVTVAKETGQAAQTIVYQNVIKMYARLWGKDNGIWIYNHDCLPQLMQMVLPVGTGGVPMWQMSARDGEPNRILGLPAFASEYMETVGTKHDIMLLNPSQVLYGLYQPLRSAESIHVRLLQHERAFKFWLEDDARGWWRSALTPNKSSDTLSPFVTLATRA